MSCENVEIGKPMKKRIQAQVKVSLVIVPKALIFVNGKSTFLEKIRTIK